MASTIENLYLKYCNRVQRYMENDAYYQYLLELVAAGKTTVTQINRVLDKTVDEKWLTAIEEALPAIHEIIGHPRRFLKTVETIAPIEQVKKVSADSVRHLASHTEYITGITGGMIMPGKLLTVENEESMDLYENRFVNTLVRKTAEFIEKRTGALFWDTGDEEMSILRVESAIEDDYESIDYKLEMTVKNKQTYMENDGSKMDIFKRIDRVRRVVTDFRASSFVQLMGTTSPVRSPIQRTNQIVKNPDYRKCYDLWQFLERYDQVGYEIDVRETALDFDEDYLFQMYGNVAMNYTVFKSLLEHDTRRITEQPKRRKAVKPKFVKQIVEEFVDDYDIPDVEIRQVIVEEVTRAQMEIQRRTKEQLKLRQAKEAEKEKAQQAREKEKEKLAREKEREKEKLRLAQEKEKEKEKLRIAKEKEAEKLRLAKEKEAEKLRLAKEKEKHLAQQAKEKEKEKLRLAKEKEADKLRLAKEKEKLLTQQAKEKEKLRLAKEKEAEKLRLAKEKEKLLAQQAKEKELEKAKAAAQKAKATAKKPAAQQPDKSPGGEARPKAPPRKTAASAQKSDPTKGAALIPAQSAPAPTQVPLTVAETLPPAEKIAPAQTGAVAQGAPKERPVAAGKAQGLTAQRNYPTLNPIPPMPEPIIHPVVEPKPIAAQTMPPIPAPVAQTVPDLISALQKQAGEQRQLEQETPSGNPLKDWMQRRRQKK